MSEPSDPISRKYTLLQSLVLVFVFSIEDNSNGASHGVNPWSLVNACHCHGAIGVGFLRIRDNVGPFGRFVADQGLYGLLFRIRCLLTII